MNQKAFRRALALSLCLVQLLQARDVNPVLLSTYPPPSGGITTDVAVSGDFVFACQGEKGLTILDISNPSAPQFVGSVDTPGFASSVVIANNLAFVADGTAGLTLVDILNPAAPAIVGVYDTPGNCTCVAVAGNLAYLADGAYGLQIIDCSTPTQPVRVGGYNTFGTALSVAISGNYTYIADGNNGLVVVDATNPDAPRKVGDHAGLLATHITIAGSYAYISSDGPLVIFDISDPLNPEPISSASVPGLIKGSSVSGTTAYIASGLGGFHVLDITDLYAPIVLGTTSLFTNAIRVAAADSLAFIADRTNGVRIIAAKNPAVMDVIAHVPIFDNIRDLVVRGNYVYLAGTNSLQIVDISKFANMRVVGTFRPSDSPSRVVVFGDYACVASGNYLGFQSYDIVNVSDPPNPVKVVSGSFQYNYGTVIDIKGAGPYMYLASSGGLLIEEMTLTNTLQQVGSFRTNHLKEKFSVVTIAIKDTSLWAFAFKYTASGAELGYFLCRIDISDPSHPTLQASSRLSDPPGGRLPVRVDLTDTQAFASFPPPVQRVHVFDLQFMAEVTSQIRTSMQNLGVETNILYFADGSLGIHVERLDGTIFMPMGGVGIPSANSIAVTTNNIFIGAGTNGLYAMTHYQPAVRLETSMNSNRTPLVKTFGPIGSSGRIQRAADLNTNSFQDWQSVQLNSYPQIFADTNSARAFYRFISP
jgi:hypothetical protein